MIRTSASPSYRQGYIVRRILLVVTVCAVAAWPAQAQDLVVDTLPLRAHTRFLADDLLMGRGTGSAGAAVAALYIESQCRRLGLDPVAGGYRQPVQLEAARIGIASRMIASTPRGSTEFLLVEDFVPDVGSAATLVGFAGPAVFVGDESVIESGQIGGLDLRGAVAVTVGPVRGPSVDTLAARGAIGLVHLVPDGETFQLYVRSRGPTRLYHRDRSIPSSFLPRLPAVLAGPRVTQTLLARATVDDSARPVVQPLAWSLRIGIESTRTPVEEANVACLLPGSGSRRDTAIVLSAHYDHLGVGAPDERGDSIYNGFSDNAAGVAMLLGVAETLVHQAAPELGFSLLLLFFTGEERGLLGSDYYVARPLWPLRQTAAVVNLDAGAPAAPPVSWRVAGIDSVDATGLGALTARVAAHHDWQVVTSPPRANSDYFPFHREGVPAIFLIPGAEPYEGLSADSSAALRQRWDHYHRPADHWSPDFPFAGLGRYATFALMVVQALDREPGALRRGRP